MGLRLVHLLPNCRLSEGGVVRAAMDLCQVMARRGHGVTLLTSDPADAPPAWLTDTPGEPRLVVVQPGVRTGARLGPEALTRARPFIDAADMVHLHGPWELGSMALARQARAAGKPYGVTIHGMLDDWSMSQKALKKKLFWRLTGRGYLKAAAWVHCTAEDEWRQASRWVPHGRSVVLPYLVDLSPFAAVPSPDQAVAAFGLPRDRPVVLFLSRMHVKKGPELFIEAAAVAQRQGLKAHWVMAGPGEEGYVASLKAMAKQQGVEASMSWPGMVSGDLKLSLYAAADLFVLPTHQENFGLVVVEAMACGCPTVTTRGTDIWRELEQAGAWIADHDAGSIARMIEQALSDRDRLRQRSREGRAFVMRWLDPERLAQRYEALYQETIGQGRSGGDD